MKKFDPKLIFPFATNNDSSKISVFKETTNWGYTDGISDVIDLSLGSCGCFPLGFKRQDFESIKDKLSSFSFISGDFSITNAYVLELCELFYKYSNGYKSIFALSGSDAVETAIKIANLTHRINNTPDKKIMLGFENSYHGSTFLSSSISGSSYLHQQFGRDSNCKTVPWDLEKLKYIILDIGASNISCLIVETCSWQAGLYAQTNEWWQEVKTICNNNNIVFIIDDIAFCGSKTGKFFGYDVELEPDLVCFGKAVSGGYYPLSGVLVSNRIFKTIKDIRFLHGFSYSFSMGGIFSALHYIDIIKKENIDQNFINCQIASSNLVASLPNINSFRNFGLMWCLDINPTIDDDMLSKLFLENGLHIGLWNAPASTKKLLIQFPTVIDNEYYKELYIRLSNVLHRI